jgi:hypothetical protein
MKQKITIIGISIILMTAGLWYLRRLFNIATYNAVIEKSVYFSFLHGHVYGTGDTVFISKHGGPESTFEIREHISGTKHELTYRSSQDVNLQGKKYDQLNPESYTDFFVIPKPGHYIVTLKGGREVFHSVFFANPTTKSNAKIKVVISDYTWVCYNNFGGRSKYQDEVTPAIVKLNGSYFERKARFYNLNIHKPNIAVSEELNGWIKDDYAFKEDKNYHLAVAEFRLLALLYERYGLESIEIMDCRGFENYEGPKKDQLFVFNGHSEYWTERMMYRLRNFRNTNHILFFSGNNIYRMVKRNNESLNLIENNIEPAVTTELTGLYYTNEGYMTNGTYRIKSPEHFLFNNVNTKTIGGNHVVSIESDKINQFTPHHVELLASGETMPGDMIIMHNNGYHLLNTGSVGSHYGLSDTNFRKVIINFIDYAVQNVKPMTAEMVSLAYRKQPQVEKSVGLSP